MMNSAIRILVFDDVSQDQRRIQKLVREMDPSEFRAECVTTRDAFLTSLGGNAHDVCIIDTLAINVLVLLRGARQVGSTLPVIAVASHEASEAIAAFREGAADCLLRDELNLDQLEWSIHHTIEQRRERKLKNEREQRYLALIENAGEVIFTHDLDGDLTSVNRAGELLTGYTREEIGHFKVIDVVAPEYRDLVSRMILRAIDERRQTSYEAGIITKGGRRLSLQVRTHLVYADGKPVALQSLARDIREC